MASPAERNHPSQYSSPGRRLRAVTADNDTDLPDGVCKAIYVGVEGHVSVIAEDDTDPVLLKNVSGDFPCRIKRVRVTGTTATDIVAIY